MAAPEVVSVEDVRRALNRRGEPTGPATLAAIAELPGPRGRPAAVLCALFDQPLAIGGPNQAHVVLTRRSSRLRSHTGEVSFPGGRLELGEEPWTAALREAYEEVDLDPTTVEVIGRLTPLTTWANPAPILPFVAALPGRPDLQANPAEVERVLMVPLVELYDAETYHDEWWADVDGSERVITFFELVGDTVWGATGRMLRDLLDVIWDAWQAERS